VLFEMKGEEYRILWFTNAPQEPLKQYLNLGSGGTGYWTNSLLKKLSRIKQLDMAVAAIYPHKENVYVNIDGVQYYLVAQKPERLWWINERRYLSDCIRLVERVKPHLIHIYGTERSYGLLAKTFKSIPILISMQGLMDPCSEWTNYYGKLKIIDVFRMERVRSILNGSSYLMNYFRFLKRAKIESEIIKYNTNFEGRTDWDKAYLMANKGEFRYFSIPRIIREEFFSVKWKYDSSQRYRIFINNCRGPRSGADLMIGAFDVVKRFYPDSRLYIAGAKQTKGNRYASHLMRLARGLGDQIEFLGYLNADKIAEELCKAHVFVSPTYIDNSPNSIAEAQVVGVPVVASCTGGKMSMVQHGKIGLLFPNGDKYLLAERIMQFFQSRELCESISKRAFEVARRRHDSSDIAQRLLQVYEQLMGKPGALTSWCPSINGRNLRPGRGGTKALTPASGQSGAFRAFKL